MHAAPPLSLGHCHLIRALARLPRSLLCRRHELPQLTARLASSATLFCTRATACAAAVVLLRLLELALALLQWREGLDLLLQSLSFSPHKPPAISASRRVDFPLFGYGGAFLPQRAGMSAQTRVDAAARRAFDEGTAELAVFLFPVVVLSTQVPFSTSTSALTLRSLLPLTLTLLPNAAAAAAAAAAATSDFVFSRTRITSFFNRATRVPSAILSLQPLPCHRVAPSCASAQAQPLAYPSFACSYQWLP